MYITLSIGDRVFRKNSECCRTLQKIIFEILASCFYPGTVVMMEHACSVLTASKKAFIRIIDIG